MVKGFAGWEGKSHCSCPSCPLDTCPRALSGDGRCCGRRSTSTGPVPAAVQWGHPCFLGTELENSSSCSIPCVSQQLDAHLKCALGGPGRIPHSCPFPSSSSRTTRMVQGCEGRGCAGRMPPCPRGGMGAADPCMWHSEHTHAASALTALCHHPIPAGCMAGAPLRPEPPTSVLVEQICGSWGALGSNPHPSSGVPVLNPRSHDGPGRG